MPPFLPMPVIAVVGSRKSGKTTTVETIIRQLATEGYRTAAIKHIHDPNFTIDAKGKDTYKFAQAGAKTIIGVAQKELATIKKTDTSRLSLTDITKNVPENTDIIILEGFRDQVKQDLTIPKIVTVKNKNEINEALRTFKPILAFTGPISRTETKELKSPYVDIQTEPGKLATIIEKRTEPIIQKNRTTTQATNIRINAKDIPLNPYVQKVTRNVLLAIITTLKGTTIKGNENITITIQTPEKTTKP